jgi:hypothetical protein
MPDKPDTDAFEAAAIEARIASAIDETQAEIFGAAFGKEETTEDETGDTSIEAMGEGLEGQIEPGDDEEEAGEEGETEGEGEAEPEPKPGEHKLGEEGQPKPPVVPEPEGRVPPGRLREQTKRAEAAEASLAAVKAETSQQIAALKSEFKAQLDGVLAALKPPAAKADDKTAEAAPDLASLIFENPNEALAQITKGVDAKVAPIAQELSNLRVSLSLQLASGRHGDTFNAAIAEIAKLDQQNPDNQRLVAQLYNSPNPGEAVVQWHKRNVTLREVGDDPAAFRQKITTETREALMKDPEFRKQLIASLQAEASGETNGSGRPNTSVRLPPSLNRANGTGERSFDPGALGDPQSIFDSAWASK